MQSKTKASANYAPLYLRLEKNSDGVQLESIHSGDILYVDKTQEFFKVLSTTVNQNIFLVQRGWGYSKAKKLEPGDKILYLGSAQMFFETLHYA